VITADNDLRACRQRKFEVFVVLRITAVGDANRRLEPDCGTPYPADNPGATGRSDGARKFRAVQDRDDF
jgi:hypothetical protein